MLPDTSIDEPSSGQDASSTNVSRSQDLLLVGWLLDLWSSKNKQADNSAGLHGKYVQRGEITMVDATDSAWVFGEEGVGG